MPTNLTAESTKAFEEAYCFSGALVDIGSTENIEAVMPLDTTTGQEFDENGTQQTVSEMTITVKTADLPSITPTTTVTIDSVVWRITGYDRNGYLGTTLNLITP